MADPSGSLFGRIVVHQKFCTSAQVAEALEISGRIDNQRHVGEILVERGYLTAAQRDQALAIQAKVEAKMKAEAGPQAQPRQPAAPQQQAPPQGQSRPQAQAAQPAPQPQRKPEPIELPEEDEPAGTTDDGQPDWLAPAHDFMGDVQTADGQTAPSTDSGIELDDGSGLELDDSPSGLELEQSPSAQAASAREAQGAPAVSQRQPAPPKQPAAPQPSPPVQPGATQTAPGSETIKQLLLTAAKYGASDLHYHVGLPVTMRMRGELIAGQDAPISAQQSEELLELLSSDQRAHFQATGDLDFAYEIPGVLRARVNFCRQLRGGIDAVFRLIPLGIPALQQLGLPNTLAKLTTYREGVVLFTGPAGCGKTTTLAAIIDLLNSERKEHILTVEDPIEFIHTSKSCLVNQREAGRDTTSFGRALRAALREDPDVIVVGELRDRDTVGLALSAAETGHLVLGTLHTNNAVRTIGRLVDAFPPSQQSQIKAMVSESLRAVVSQRLLPTIDGKRRIPATEILIVTPAIGNLIRESKTFQIPAMMQTQKALGMRTLDDSLFDLVQAEVVSKEAAAKVAENPKRFA